MRHVILILLLPVLLLVGCAAALAENQEPSKTAVDPTQLQRSWLLVELDGRPPLAGSQVTLTFQEGALGGNAGCNSYGSPYQAGADGSLQLSELVHHEVLCLDDGVMEQEAAYLKALGTIASFEIDDDGQTLLLRDASGAVVLRFAAHTAAGGPVEPGGQVWELAGFVTVTGGVEEAEFLLAGSHITLEFDTESGQLFGTAGCNSYNAGYTLDDDGLRIGPPASTLMYCGEPEGLMDQESRFLGWLEEVEELALDGGRLTLHLADGRYLLFTAD